MRRGRIGSPERWRLCCGLDQEWVQRVGSRGFCLGSLSRVAPNYFPPGLHLSPRSCFCAGVNVTRRCHSPEQIVAATQGNRIACSSGSRRKALRFGSSWQPSVCLQGVGSGASNWCAFFFCYGLLQALGYGSLCQTAGPHCLSILQTITCTCWSQLPTTPPTPAPWQPQSVLCVFESVSVSQRGHLCCTLGPTYMCYHMVFAFLFPV